MAQLQWKVPSIGGRAYQVGLYHGEDSGHLVVYINNKVTLVDFGVTESKDYSFFLEQELFELTISKRGPAYDYSLTHNEELDTPHNVQRRRHQRYERLNLWVGGSILVLMLAIAIAVFSRYAGKNEEAYSALQRGGGVATVGRVLERDSRWYIQFVADKAVVREPLPAADTIHPLGFPLVTGDELPVRYRPEDPGLLLMDWEERLSAAQLERYRERVLARHLTANPGLAPRQVACQLDIAYRELGLTGWALFFHQDTTYNDSLNRAAYLRFVRDPEVAEELRVCL